MGSHLWFGRSVTALAAVLLGVSAAPVAAQSNYTYTVIAASDCYTPSEPALGNNGEAAFMAVGHCGVDRVVRKGDGVTLTDVYVYSATSSYSIPDPYVSINDLGVVAFKGAHTDGTGYTILVGSGGPVTVVADTSVHTQWTNVAKPSINNAMAVAFHAEPALGAGYNMVIRADGGTFTTIAQPEMIAPAVGIIERAFEPALNNAGQVEFFVQTKDGIPAIFRSSGGALTKIVAGGAINTFNGINDAGRVAFYISSVGVRSGTGGALTTIASPDDVFHSFSSVAINNSNAVAFGAQTWAGPHGIFVGDGVLTQAVIQTGDDLSEIGLGPITFVTMGQEAINDHGQIAFAVRYHESLCDCLKSAVVRADPILPQIAQLKLSPIVAGCKNVSATVKLDRPAPPGGVLIDISNTNPEAAAPPTLKVASAKASGKFVITTVPVLANQTGTVAATLGASTQTKPLTVRPIGVQSVALSPNPVIGGNSVTGTATLECAAAPNDITVSLSSTNPAVAQPATASLLFAAGTRTMTFPVSTSAVAVTSSATIKAVANGITKSKKLTVTP